MGFIRRGESVLCAGARVWWSRGVGEEGVGGGGGRLVSVLVRERLFFLSVSSASLFSFIGR